MRVRTLLLLGLAAREVFSFWTGHPYDFELWVRTGYWVARGGNPYGFVNPAPGVSFVDNIAAGGNPTIAYLPFWPLLLAAIYSFYALLGSPSPLLYYFLIKQPIILCDILLAYLLYRYLERRGSAKSRFVLKVWLFSPLNIILAGIWGMFEAIPALFVMCALTVRPGAYRGVWEGLATFAKSVPLIFTIPLSSGPKPLRNIALAVGVPVVASLAVVWLEGWSSSIFNSTLQSTVAKGGLSMSIWEAAFYLNTLNVFSSYPSWLWYLIGYAWVVGVLVATVAAYRWFGFDTERGVVRSLLLVTLAFLLLRGVVTTQYSVYLMALALVDYALWSPRRLRLFYASLAAVLMLLVTNDVLLIRFLAPVYPQSLAIEWSIITAINPERDFLLFAGAMVFSAVNAFYIYALAKERGSRTPDVELR